MSLCRRSFLTILTATTGTVGGCLDTGTPMENTPTESSLPSESSASEPSTKDTTDDGIPDERAGTFLVYVVNHTNKLQQVRFTIETPTDERHTDDEQLGADGDDKIIADVAEFPDPGTYTITCETNEFRQMKPIDVRRDELEDCNYTSGAIYLLESGIEINKIRTEAACRKV